MAEEIGNNYWSGRSLISQAATKVSFASLSRRTGFISAFFGCLYAGVIAVPVYPSRRNQKLSRLLAVANNAQAKLALTTTSILADVEKRWSAKPELAQFKLLATDTIEANNTEFVPQSVNPKSLAFLQYTSGSTGTPKGVMVTHRNIIHNQQLIHQAFGHGEQSIGVGWLPLFHDMGLIGHVLQPLYIGLPSILMPPEAFLMKPIRWLKAISRYKATTSGGPNFAYDLCVKKIKPEELAGLDVSSWDLAYSGAEPVRGSTLEQFSDKFAKCGFNYNAFYPCYGMAETTLFTTGGNKHRKPVIKRVDAGELKFNSIVESEVFDSESRVFVGVGRPYIDTKVVIVNPNSLTRCQSGEVGEIWVRGGSVASGYWNSPQTTQETFQAYLKDTESDSFLRTGDLGFFSKGELFITGRLKDLIIIRGRNYYPQDIELTVENSHPALRNYCSAAFSIELAGKEHLAIACEVERTYLRKLNVDEVVSAIKIAVSTEHELEVDRIVLLKTGTIPKTSSGKIQRRACKLEFLLDRLNVVGQWGKAMRPRALKDIAECIPLGTPSDKGTLIKTANKQNPQLIGSTPTSNSQDDSSQNDSKTVAEIEAWLADKIAELLQIAPETIGLNQPLDVYGLDSVKAVSIAAELEAWLGISVAPTIVYDYPSIQALANYFGQKKPLQSSAVVSHPQTATDSVAIIGKGCRFPQANNPQAFWSLLRSGNDAITKVPASRWRSQNGWGGFVSQVDRFDAQFFSISPREASNIDPQQRLLLEVSWSALENAGLAAEQLAGSRGGVFIGISSGDYAKLGINLTNTEAYYGTGNALSIAANRLSYFLDWRGPSLAVDTACSSSLVAVHQACQSLIHGECNLALAGGVNLILTPQLTMTFDTAQMMAADGRCKTFDANADGYVRGEGCGVVVLKRLADALADGDNIQAVIKGSAINQDGQTNGLTAPNSKSQQEVIRLALAKAGVKPNQISYVEAHGTGTSLLGLLADSDRSEDRLALRGDKIYVSRLVKQSPAVERSPSLKSDATYLITGGLGALGLQTAAWMVEKGARHLVLTGRKQPSAKAQETIEQLQNAGAQILVLCGDISRQEDVTKILSEIETSLPPLRGVIHAAGLLDDSFLQQMSWDKFTRVMKPKIQGAWHLHSLTQDLPLDFFVCFSSMASVLGSPGQGNYAAANAFMDALVHYRRARGLPGLSINWGAWGEIGMASRLGNNYQNQMAVSGINFITPQQGMKALDRTISAAEAQIGLFNIDWHQFEQKLPPNVKMPLLEELISVRPVLAASNKDSFLSELKQTTVAELGNKLSNYLQDCVAQVVGMETEQIDVAQPLVSLGVDSLMAMEIRNQVQTDLEIDILITKFMEEIDVATLAIELNEQLTQIDPQPNLLSATKSNISADTYPLSYGQKALWFLWKLEPLSSAYNLTYTCRISSEINIQALREAWQILCDRHPLLHSIFIQGETEPVHKPIPSQELDFKAIDVSNLSHSELEQKVKSESQRPFDLEHKPVIRLRLFNLAATENILLLTIHHIAVDGLSRGILVEEFQLIYQALLSNTKPALALLQNTYRDYVRWQRDLLAGESGAKLWQYWQKKLGGDLPVLNLPTDKPRPPVQTYNGSSYQFCLSEQLTEDLKQLAKQEKVTLYTLLLAVYNVLLYRYTGQEDILVGTPTSGRTKSEFVSLVGYFVDPVVMRANLTGNPSFSDFLGQNRQTVVEALAHQDFPFALLVERLQPDRELSHSPIFQTTFDLYNLKQFASLPTFLTEEQTTAGLKIEPWEIRQQEGQFDLDLEMQDDGTSLTGVFKYNTDLFNESTIARMANHFQVLLEAVVVNPQQPLGQLPLLTEAERHQLLVEWNDTAKEYPQDKCIHQLFEFQVKQNPDAVAVVFEQEQLTYQQLNRQANQLARYLKTLEVKPETLVGICVERSVEMVVAILGVLKAGGAYLPLDPAYPQARLNYMLSDSGVEVLLTQSSLLASLPLDNLRLICLDTDGDAIARQSQDNLDRSLDPDNLAYIINTSGSTGVPKGVLVTHRSLVNAYFAWEEAYQLQTEVRNLMEYLEQTDRDLSFMKLAIVGSDSWYLEEHEQLRNLCDRHTRLINSYGVTEATVDSCYFEDTFKPELSGKLVPIGKPFPNVQIYILDSHLQPVPVGVPGELYIGGDRLAKGYHNRPVLTQAKFIPNPFPNPKSERLYKTGDRVRYLSNGNIEFLGRIDNQVKIRGFRIELGEIESVLNAHPQVQQAVVIATKEPSNKRLVAYLVSEDKAMRPRAADRRKGKLIKKAIASKPLREFLKQKLPEYMLPSIFVTLDTLPLTANGKVDRKALPAANLDLTREREYIAPRTTLELQMTQIWSKVLNINSVGVQDNFFELGGHSLLAVRLMSEIQRQFQKNLPLATLFQNPTIEKLACLLDSPANTTNSPNSLLVPIKTSGKQPPLFLIHPVGGNVLCYADLASRLDGDCPVYGLQSLGLDGQQQPLMSIEEMASHYIKAIQQVQPYGSYHLIGWSMGGVIAYEMAQQLQAKNESVALLGLIDSYAPTVIPQPSEIDRATIINQLAQDWGGIYGRELDISLATLRKLEPDEQVQHLFEQAKQQSIFPQEIKIEQMLALWSVFQANVIADYHYQPKPYSGSILLINASETPSEIIEDPTHGWGSLILDEIQTHIITGDHYTIMRSPQIEDLTATINSYLQNLRGQQQKESETIA